MRNNRTLNSISLALSAVLFSQHAYGQNSNAESGVPFSGNEIVVTAQKREQSINDVGLTIQAATANTLQQRGIDSPADLGKLDASKNW